MAKGAASASAAKASASRAPARSRERSPRLQLCSDLLRSCALLAGLSRPSGRRLRAEHGAEQQTTPSRLGDAGLRLHSGQLRLLRRFLFAPAASVIPCAALLRAEQQRMLEEHRREKERRRSESAVEAELCRPADRRFSCCPCQKVSKGRPRWELSPAPAPRVSLRYLMDLESKRLAERRMPGRPSEQSSRAQHG